MNNHLHLIWLALQSFTPSQNQASFMKYTAQQSKRVLIKHDKDSLVAFKLNKYDRDYQFWKGEP
jgi:REP element-mobilizing transposase RayT